MRTLLYYELKKIFGIRRTLILSGAALLVCLASYWFTANPGEGKRPVQRPHPRGSRGC